MCGEAVPSATGVVWPVLAVDPGPLSGLAWAYGPPSALEPPETAQVEFLSLWPILNRLMPRTVVVERFVPRRGPMDLTPVEVIGTIKTWAHRYGPVLLVLQTPAQAKHFFTNERLAERGNKIRGTGPHALDALRHLHYFMEFSKGAS